MKVVIYTLTPTGETPDYIIDGGYFPKVNGMNSPQDYDLVGIANDSAPGEVLSLKSDILSYCETFMEPYEDQFNSEIYTVEELVNSWCLEKNVT